jgi:hypothetical protein
VGDPDRRRDLRVHREGLREVLRRLLEARQRRREQSERTRGGAPAQEGEGDHAPLGLQEVAVTTTVIDRVQRDGTCWLGSSTFRGRAVMRISIVGWQTTAHDIDRSADAILTAAR